MGVFQNQIIAVLKYLCMNEFVNEETQKLRVSPFEPWFTIGKYYQVVL